MRLIGILALSVVLSGVAAGFAKKAAARNGVHSHTQNSGTSDKGSSNDREGGAPEPATVLLLALGATVAAVKKVRSLSKNQA